MVSEMPEQIQTKCPFCGTTRLIGRTKWGKFSSQDYFIQARSAPGGKIAGTSKGYRGSAKGKGFHIIPEESLRLTEIDENSKYFEEVKKLAAGARRIVNLLEDNGF